MLRWPHGASGITRPQKGARQPPGFARTHRRGRRVAGGAGGGPLCSVCPAWPWEGAEKPAGPPPRPSGNQKTAHFPGELQPHHPPGPRPFSPTSTRDTFWNQPGRPPPFAVMGFLQEARGRSDCGSNRVCSRRTLRPTPRHHLRGRSGLPQAGLRGRGSRGLGAGGPGALGPEVQEGDFCKSLRDRWGGLCARVSV